VTEHSIEELRRQLDAARSRLADATVAEALAKARLDKARIAKAEAEFAARGIAKGSRVTVDGAAGVYLGHDVTISGRAFPQIAKLKKNGAPHATLRFFTWSESVIEPEQQP
jgi:hypothetical protein